MEIRISKKENEGKKIGRRLKRKRTTGLPLRGTLTESSSQKRDEKRLREKGGATEEGRKRKEG